MTRRHAVKVRLVHGPMLGCQVEIDGVEVHGLQAISFGVGMDRRPTLTLTVKPQSIELEGADVPIVVQS